jgi:hypothetical protein
MPQRRTAYIAALTRNSRPDSLHVALALAPALNTPQLFLDCGKTAGEKQIHASAITRRSECFKSRHGNCRSRDAPTATHNVLFACLAYQMDQGRTCQQGTFNALPCVTISKGAEGTSRALGLALGVV